MRANRYVAATIALLAIGCGVVATPPASASSCPIVLPDHTVLGTSLSYLSGCNLDGANLDGVTITGGITSSSMKGASLQGAVLRSVSLANTDLTDADLTGADLTGASGGSLVLDGARFDGAQLTGAHLGASSADGARFASAQLDGARIAVAHGTPVLPGAPGRWILAAGYLIGPGADLNNVTLDDPVVTGVSLARTDLRYAVITGGSFSGADLAWADFRNTRITSTVFTNATGWANAWWAGASRVLITCPDGVQVVKHNRYDCLAGVDTVAPTLTAGGASNTWADTDAYSSWPLTAVESGSGLLGVRYASRTAASGRTSFSRWTVGDWTGIGDRLQMDAWPQREGTRVCVKAQAQDLAGNVGAWTAERCSDLPYEETTAFNGWLDFTRIYRSTGGWSGGAFMRSKQRGASTEYGVRVGATRIGVVATTCPSCGRVAVYLGATKVASFNLARPTTTMRTRVTKTLETRIIGRPRLVVTSPTGKLVRIDGLAVSAW